MPIRRKHLPFSLYRYHLLFCIFGFISLKDLPHRLVCTSPSDQVTVHTTPRVDAVLDYVRYILRLGCIGFSF